MSTKKTTRSRLRVTKDTLRSLSADEAAQVHGGKKPGPWALGVHPNSPRGTNYCLIGDF